MSRFASSVLCLLALLLGGCERQKRHEALARSLERPAAELCRAWHKEGGGCNADCMVWGAATEAKAALAASEGLAVLPPLEDPEVEPLVAKVRSAARGVSVAVKARCSSPVERTSPPNENTRACAEARGAPEISALFAAMRALSEAAAASTGVGLPNGTSECEN